MVNNRYQLGECLFSTSMGELYQARDMNPVAPAKGHPEVLIHFLPSRTLGYTSVKRVLDYLQLKGQDIDSRLLPVLDGGWSGTEAFFVMRTPDSWSINALPPVKGAPTSLHVKALAMTADLVARHLIKQGLEPECFLVTPGGDLHLLGTALAEELQSVKPASPTLLRPESLRVPKRSRWLSPFSLLLLSGVSVAGSMGVYYAWQQQATLPRTLETGISAVAIQPIQSPVSVLDNPSTQLLDKDLPLETEKAVDEADQTGKTEKMAGVVATVEPDRPDPVAKPEPQAELAAVPEPVISPEPELAEKMPEPEPTPALEPAAVSAPVLVEASVPEPEITPEPPVPEQKELEVAMLGQPSMQPSMPVEAEAVEPAVNAEPVAQEQVEEDPATLSLIDRADNAIKNQRLQTALYFIRLLRLSRPDHPQVKSLAGQVVTLYQQQAQEATEDSAAAGTLSLSRNVIDDFSLPAHFQSRQTELEQGGR